MCVPRCKCSAFDKFSTGCKAQGSSHFSQKKIGRTDLGLASDDCPPSMLASWGGGEQPLLTRAGRGRIWPICVHLLYRLLPSVLFIHPSIRSLAFIWGGVAGPMALAGEGQTPPPLQPRLPRKTFPGMSWGVLGASCICGNICPSRLIWLLPEKVP